MIKKMKKIEFKKKEEIEEEKKSYKIKNREGQK